MSSGHNSVFLNCFSIKNIKDILFPPTYHPYKQDHWFYPIYITLDACTISWDIFSLMKIQPNVPIILFIYLFIFIEWHYMELLKLCIIFEWNRGVPNTFPTATSIKPLHLYFWFKTKKKKNYLFRLEDLRTLRSNWLDDIICNKVMNHTLFCGDSISHTVVPPHTITFSQCSVRHHIYLWRVVLQEKDRVLT